MKKIIVLMLCLVMAMSLAACGGNKSTEEAKVESVQIEAANTAEETQKPADSAETTMPTETEATIPEETTPVFDTSWASNHFEAMIPELPFTGWTVTEETDSNYELELGGLKTANGADTASGYEEDKDALITYLDSLPAYGFTVEEIGGIPDFPYKWIVTDPSGNTIEVICSDGYCWITFNSAN